MKSRPKTTRHFSTDFKKEKVGLLDKGKITVSELSRIYSVSPPAIYKWKKKFSSLDQTERIVIEKISEGRKNIELLNRIKELEQIIGKKQIELDYYKATVDILSEQNGENLLKKFKPK
jgi:transposase-like protein